MNNKEVNIEKLLAKIQILKEEVGLTNKKIVKNKELKKAIGY
ncbi:hypothetical protein Arnit_2683 [Arcobacter nitrofigilis DSM 7299]|uniref:Uncharacterized protein n=1 Tax=Arcobacter nitrofigilis (strain ATCC 33309 / DSM 7299 / CCUG 15893 / LMG 7604 / NCTC 12251 / CI) TaxID=572480 RepID=D5V6R1_ARCNC|nr:hypothetical protein [Arcobacter nitrofigilis]ADG94331.1 hypothetical protein Arnit_2683 [Arcobacter nitrofigilis DSM 7299]